MSVEYTPRNMSVLENITSVVADSDLDGLMAAAILKAAKPELTVEFSHAALIRSGLIDEKISKQTALCDLPFHPNCGLYLDHHMTNRPSSEEEKQFVLQGGICHWRDTPSAARAAYDLMKEEVDLDHLVEIMPIVDALDSGGISLERFLEDGEIIRLSRSLSLREPEHLNTVLEQFASGEKLEQILASHSDRLNQLSKSRKQESDIVSKNIEGIGENKDVKNINNDEMILDIGPKTISMIKKIVNDSNTVLWNGPAGYFENPNFQNGTKEIVEIISQKTINDTIFSVAGGGETVAAINKFKKIDTFTFVSTAGGAFLEYLEGKELPGIKALNQNV